MTFIQLKNGTLKIILYLLFFATNLTQKVQIFSYFLPFIYNLLSFLIKTICDLSSLPAIIKKTTSSHLSEGVTGCEF